MTEPERNRSPAYTVLRASARRVDRLIQSEIARQGGCATIFNDQFEICGSRRVWRPAAAEIGALGLAEITRHPKRYICRPSDRWRGLTMQDALIASAMAREHRNDDAGAWPPC
jgi:hypothetical protein